MEEKGKTVQKGKRRVQRKEAVVEREVVVEAEEERGAMGTQSSPSKMVGKSVISRLTTACSNLAPARQLSGSV